MTQSGRSLFLEVEEGLNDFVTSKDEKDEAYNELFESIAKRLEGRLTAIRTLLESDKKEHSGSALLINGGNGLLYCLTAEHVLVPGKREPPSTTKIRHNYLVEPMKVSGTTPSKLLQLRRNYFFALDLDIALSETWSSGTSFAAESGHAASPSAFAQIPSIGSLQSEDLLLITGFPSAKVTELHFMKSANYGLHGYFFKANDIVTNDMDAHHYRIAGKPIGFEPDGLSGSPVWLVRALCDTDTGQGGGVLDPLEGSSSKYELIFFGIVVRYLSNKKTFVAVRGEICATFVLHGLEAMPKIRDKDEQQQIMDIVKDMIDSSTNYGK